MYIIKYIQVIRCPFSSDHLSPVFDLDPFINPLRGRDHGEQLWRFLGHRLPLSRARAASATATAAANTYVNFLPANGYTGSHPFTEINLLLLGTAGKVQLGEEGGAG